MAYGFYQVGQSNRERRAIKKAHFEARAALVPFLQVRGCSLLFYAGLLGGGSAQWLGGAEAELWRQAMPEALLIEAAAALART